MASRYSQEYFFQHCLMNILFTDLNEIIHPSAESIPEYIRHFTSALFLTDSFWNNVNAITHELQVEGNSDDYINSYLSYVNMIQATYNLVNKGKSLFYLFYCCLFYLLFFFSVTCSILYNIVYSFFKSIYSRKSSSKCFMICYVLLAILFTFIDVQVS